MPKILENSIEVNRLNPRESENLYSHVLLGVAQWKNDMGQIENYAIRSIVDERKDGSPILSESNIICRLYASTAKKMANTSDNVSMQSISTYSEDSPTISIADILENVKDYFKDTLSDDVYDHFGMAKASTAFSKELQFSLKDSVEEKEELIAVHNLSEEKLLKSLSLGGLPMPSIAVLKAKNGHSQYGDISLIFDKSTIDPQATSANKVYSGDAWTPTYPFIEYKPNEKVVNHIRDKYYELYRKYGNKSAKPLYGYANEAERKLQNSGGEAGLMEELANDKRMMELFLLDTTGKEFKPIYTEKKAEIPKEQQAEYDRIIETLGAEAVNEIIPTAGESPMLHRKEYFAKHKEALESLFPHDTKSFPPEIKNAPNRYCLNCGKPFYSLRGQALYCSDCSGNARAKTTVRERVCVDCGAKFMGWPRSKRCPDCQAEAKLKYDREHKRKGSARKLGSVDVCACCGKEYTVEGGSQKYCKACAAEATHQNILAHKKEYNAKNQKRLKGIAKAKQEIIKEPPDKADKE